MRVNHENLIPRATSHLALLTALAWFSPKHAVKTEAGYLCQVDRAEIPDRIYRFLWDEIREPGKEALRAAGIASPAAFRAALKTALYADLKSLTGRIQHAGGIAFEQRVPLGSGNRGFGRRYTAVLHSLPTW
ncbi:MAG: hypothetical protein H7A45_00490 [Verrucomicrobiales bacterium]|nr:hypothetical protein [Verrucomicrobiales bacterium]MCP5525260.1 hypothetical protein [Verrucomicrobiales bacterium]